MKSSDSCFNSYKISFSVSDGRSALKTQLEFLLKKKKSLVYVTFTEDSTS